MLLYVSEQQKRNVSKPYNWFNVALAVNSVIKCGTFTRINWSTKKPLCKSTNTVFLSCECAFVSHEGEKKTIKFETKNRNQTKDFKHWSKTLKLSFSFVVLFPLLLVFFFYLISILFYLMFVIVLCVAFFDVSHANVLLFVRVYVWCVCVRAFVFVFEMTHMHFPYWIYVLCFLLYSLTYNLDSRWVRFTCQPDGIFDLDDLSHT